MVSRGVLVEVSDISSKTSRQRQSRHSRGVRHLVKDTSSRHLVEISSSPEGLRMRAHSPFRSGAVVQSLLLAVLASCAQGSPSSPSGPGELGGPLPDLRREAISAHIQALADDRLEGRGTGTPGHRQAALYVAEQLRSLGIVPAGDNGTFFQEVLLRFARLESATFE